MSIIKTPDQRLRVFVSSTLRELAEERAMAQEAIKRLLMAPVMFELGARPHPPRDLYKSYLDQSQIFIGIYWQSYGWIAPDMEISGLEDEFILSEGKPRLIYLKEPAPERQDRLTDMLKRISGAESNVSYRTFSTPLELKQLIENDLALLISERFEEAEDKPQPTPGRKILPVAKNVMIGRDREILRLKELISSAQEKLITITGAGGTGKTTLALHIAHQCKNQFKDGVAFIPLASVSDPEQLANAISTELGLFDSGKMPVRDLLIGYLIDKNLLLILDNFEQLLGSVKMIADLTDRCPAIQLIVTSRTPLYIRGECLFPLTPLDLPDQATTRPEEVCTFSSVQLYQKKATEANPNIRWTEENLRAAAQICRRLDGLPLAIELAAARSRILSPVHMLQRLEDSLDLLVKGPRDLPVRQQTLTATIEWSYMLLDDPARMFLRGISVFDGGWSIESAHKILMPDAEENEVLFLTEKLLDHNLIYAQEDQSFEGPRFHLYQTVREYAKMKQGECGETISQQKAMVSYYAELAEKTDPFLWLPDRDHYFTIIERDFGNIRASFHYAQLNACRDQAWQLVANLGQYWAYRGYLSEALSWFEQLGIKYKPGEFEQKTEDLPNQIAAKGLFTAGVVRFLTGQFKQAMADLEFSISLYEKTSDQVGLARVLAFAGVTGLSAGNPEAGKYLQRGFELGQSIPDISTTIMAATFLTEVYSHQGEFEKANEMIQIAEQACLRIGDKSVLAIVKTQRGNLLIPAGKLAEAKNAYREALKIFTPGMIGSYKGWTYIGLAYCEMQDSQWGAAMENYSQGLNLARMMGDISVIMVALFGYAALGIHKGKEREAARIMGACDQILHNTGYSMWRATRSFYETTKSILNSSLDQDALEAELKTGRTLIAEEAIALALSIERIPMEGNERGSDN